MSEEFIKLTPEEQKGISLLVRLNKGNATVIYANTEVGLVELTYTVKHVPTPPTEDWMTVIQN